MCHNDNHKDLVSHVVSLEMVTPPHNNSKHFPKQTSVRWFPARSLLLANW